MGRRRVVRRRPRSRARALAPICVAGFTDSHWLREAFGTVAYGFFPARAFDPETAARLIHSADERVPVDDLELGVATCGTRRAPSAVRSCRCSSCTRRRARSRRSRTTCAERFCGARARRRPLPRLRALGSAAARRRAARRPSRAALPLARLPRPAGGEAPAAPPAAARASASGSRRWAADDYAAAIEAVRAAIARGDVYQVNLVQHLSAPFAGDPVALAALLAPLRPLQPAAAHRRRLGDRLGVAGAASWRGAAAARDDADQGHAARRRGRRRPEGRGRARDDRRPRAERPRARLRSRARSAGPS